MKMPDSLRAEVAQMAEHRGSVPLAGSLPVRAGVAAVAGSTPALGLIPPSSVSMPDDANPERT